MTMKKTVVGDIEETFTKAGIFKGRELSSTEERAKQFQEITFSIGKFDDENRTFQAIASTPVVDRQGDSVQQDGWYVENFLMNPVIPWAHDYSTPPVGRAIEIGINGQGNLQFTYQAPPEGMYELADTVWNLYRNQFMFAFSVGFIPMDYEGDWKEGYTFTKAELLEISAVVVPANPQAVALSYKGGYITEQQAKSLRGKMAQTLKQLEETMAKAKAAGVPANADDTKEPQDKPTVEEEVVEKGALADALANDVNYSERWSKLEPVDDIYWTFVDLWFSATTSDDQWVPLLKEMANLMMAVANGEYTPPADNDSGDGDDDWDDLQFLGVGLKNGVDKDKIKELLVAVSKKVAEERAKGLTKGQKVKDNSIMTESQEAALKSLDEKLNAEIEANAEFRKSVLEILGKGQSEEENKDLSTEGKTDEDNKPEVTTVPAADTDEKVVAKPVEEPAKADESQTEEVSNEEDKQPKVEQGEVKSAEKSDDGADHKDKKEDDLIDPENLTEEQQEEFIKFYNEELEKNGQAE